LQNFDIGGPRERMPEPIVRAFGILKKCAAKVQFQIHCIIDELIVLAFFIKKKKIIIIIKRKRNVLIFSFD
jgi:fumarate hydratase class II